MRNVSTWKRLLHRTVSNNANLVTVSFLCAESSKDCGADVERVYDESPGKMDEVWLALLDDRTEAIYDREVDALYKKVFTKRIRYLSYAKEI